MSSEGFTLSETFKKNVWLVAFDMDQTSLDIHTSGVVVKENETIPPELENSGFRLLNAKEVLTHVKDAIKVIIPELLKNGIMVAICTNTDMLMAQSNSLMGGRELVEYIMGNTFDQYPDICDHLIIEAWRGTGQAVMVGSVCICVTRSTVERTTIWRACGSVWIRNSITTRFFPKSPSRVSSVPTRAIISRACPKSTW